MTLSDYKTLLKGMSEAQKDAFLIEYFKRQNRQDKEMLGILLTCIRDGKELPSKSERVIDMKKADRLYEAFVKRISSLPYARASVRRKLKKTAKELTDLLPLMPVQAEEYEAACALYRKLIYIICAVANSYGYVVSSIFDELSLRPVFCFDTYMTMVLATGTSPEKIESLVSLYGNCFFTDEEPECFELLEHIERRITNGDLRFELIERIESMFSTQSEPAMSGCQKQTFGLFYLILCSREDTLDEGEAFLGRALGNRQAVRCRRVFDEAMREQKKREEARIRAAMS